ncbi:hypothetical protein [Nocardia sp. NPDC003726]
MNEDAKAEIARFARELGLLREAVGAPSFKRMYEALPKIGRAPASEGTLRNAEKSGAFPKLATVVQFVESCRLIARADRLDVDQSRFRTQTWQDSWYTVNAVVNGAHKAEAALSITFEPTATAEVGRAGVDRILAPGQTSQSFDPDAPNWLWVPKTTNSSYLLIGSGPPAEWQLSDPGIHEFAAMQSQLAAAAPGLKVTSLYNPERSAFTTAVTAAAREDVDLLIVHLLVYGYLGPDLRLYSPCADSAIDDLLGSYAPVTSMIDELLGTAVAKALVLIIDTSLAAYALNRARAATLSKPCAVVTASGENQALSGWHGLTSALTEALRSGAGNSAFPVLPMYELTMAAREVLVTRRRTMLNGEPRQHSMLPPLDITITTNHGGDRIAWAQNHAFRARGSE